MKVSIKPEGTLQKQEIGNKDEYVVDFDMPFGDYQHGDIICNVAPWEASGCPFTLEFAIRQDGSIVFRSWKWSGNASCYAHVVAKLDDDLPTDKQIDVVSGMFSGRTLVFGLSIAPGKTLIDLCPINIEEEEAKIGHKIFLR